MTKYSVGDKGFYSKKEGTSLVKDTIAEIVKVNDNDTYDVKLSLSDGSQRVEHQVKAEQFEVRD